MDPELSTDAQELLDKLNKDAKPDAATTEKVKAAMTRAGNLMDDPHVQRLIALTAEMDGKTDAEITELSRRFNSQNA